METHRGLDNLDPSLSREGYGPDLLNALTDFDVSFEISQEDAKHIQDMIEGFGGNGMINKTANEIFLQSKMNGCIVVKKGKEIVSFVTMMQFPYCGVSYERGSFVFKSGYDKNIAKHMIKSFLEKYSDRKLFCVTMNKLLVKINEELGLHKFSKDNTPRGISSIIDSVSEFSSNYSVFVNENLKKVIY